MAIGRKQIDRCHIFRNPPRPEVPSPSFSFAQVRPASHSRASAAPQVACISYYERSAANARQSVGAHPKPAPDPINPAHLRRAHPPAPLAPHQPRRTHRRRRLDPRLRLGRRSHAPHLGARPARPRRLGRLHRRSPARRPLRPIDPAIQYRSLGAPSIPRDLRNGWETAKLFSCRINTHSAIPPHAPAPPLPLASSPHLLAHCGPRRLRRRRHCLLLHARRRPRAQLPSRRRRAGLLHPRPFLPPRPIKQ